MILNLVGAYRWGGGGNMIPDMLHDPIQFVFSSKEQVITQIFHRKTRLVSTYKSAHSGDEVVQRTCLRGV